MKIIHFTDTHLETDDEKTTFTLQRLVQLKEYINHHFARFDFCIVTGDLVSNNKQEPYKELYKKLMDFKMPVYCVIGNHDNADAFRRTFAHYNFESNHKCYYKKESDNNLFLFLDTHRDNYKGGELGNEQLLWLKRQLDFYATKNVYIVMHHHFFKSYNASLDCMDLKDKNQFLDIVKKYGCIKHIFLGHLHMNLLGKIANISYSCTRSIKYQISYNETSLIHTTEDVNPSICIATMEEEDFSIFYQDIKLDS